MKLSAHACSLRATWRSMRSCPGRLAAGRDVGSAAGGAGPARMAAAAAGAGRCGGAARAGGAGGPSVRTFRARAACSRPAGRAPMLGGSARGWPRCRCRLGLRAGAALPGCAGRAGLAAGRPYRHAEAPATGGGAARPAAVGLPSRVPAAAGIAHSAAAVGSAGEEGALQVHVLKRRGAPLLSPMAVPAHGSALAMALAATSGAKQRHLAAWREGMAARTAPSHLRVRGERPEAGHALDRTAVPAG